MDCCGRVLDILAILYYLQKSYFWTIRENFALLLLLLIVLEYSVTLNPSPGKVQKASTKLSFN